MIIVTSSFSISTIFQNVFRRFQAASVLNSKPNRRIKLRFHFSAG